MGRIEYLWKELNIYMTGLGIFIGDITADNGYYFGSIIFPVILLYYIVTKTPITVEAVMVQVYRFNPIFPMCYHYTWPL